MRESAEWGGFEPRLAHATFGLEALLAVEKCATGG
jgi:hypothetical protein